MSRIVIIEVLLLVVITATSVTKAINGSNSTTNSTQTNTTDTTNTTTSPIVTQSSTDAPTTPGTTTPPPTTIPTTPHPCLMARKPTDDEFSLCDNERCAKELLEALELSIRCGKQGNAGTTDHPTKMADLGEGLAMKISQHIKTHVESTDPNKGSINESVFIATDQLAMGASILDASMYVNATRGMFYFPNISKQDVAEKLGDRIANSILYPKKHLPLTSGIVQVGWSISEVSNTKVPESEVEPYKDIVWKLPVSDIKIEKNKMLISKKKPILAINSPVITFSLAPKPEEPLADPFHIAFRRLTNSGVKNHRCCSWAQSSSSTGFWSSVGCDVRNNDTHTICSCNHMSTFVVLSEIENEDDDGAKKAVRIVAILLCVLAMAALGGTIQMTRKLDCLDNDRVTIHINLCIVLLIGYVLFIIGVIKSDIKAVNEILAFSLHFCQLSPLVWLSLEAVYFFDTIHPIIDRENTNSRKFYTSLGWAVTAAFAGAAAGYDLPHNGQPHASEFAWIFINKVKDWPFLGPYVVFFVVNISIRVASLIRLTKYTKTSDEDKKPLRIMVNLLTTVVLAVVVFMAWYFGIKAVNNTETKGYHYGFLVLYCFQALLILVIYGWQNEEMWTIHNKRKEEERKIEERKITFTYVP